jgi:Xaa-Pro dipeptidase
MLANASASRYNFSERESQGRLERAREAMAARGLAGTLCVAPETLCYLSGYDAISYLDEQALILTADGSPPALLVRDVDVPLAEEFAWVTDIRPYHHGADDPWAVVAKLLDERGVFGDVGVEMRSHALPYENGLALVRHLGPARRAVDASGWLAGLRARKSAEELVYVRAAAKLGNDALRTVLDELQPAKTTELQVAAALDHAVGIRGGEYAPFPTNVSSGPRTVAVHATPTDRILRSGEPLYVCIAAVRRRYYVASYRTVHLGEPSARFAEVYSAAEDALGALEEAAKPGVPLKRAADAAAAHLRDRGLGHAARARWGYGVGLCYPPTWLEPPEIVEESYDRFEAGMVLCMHVCLSLPKEGFGIEVGSDYIVHNDCAEPLDALGPSLIVI